MLLPREHLLLSALDLAQPQGDFPASRLFESKIKILDLEGRLGSNVLLARSETTRMVYAVESESPGLYVLCKLGSWVDIDALARSATVVCRQRMRSTKPAKPENTTPAPLTTPAMYNENKRRRLAIDEIQSLVRKRSMSVLDKDAQSQTPVAPAPEAPPMDEAASQKATPVQETPDFPPVESGPSVPSGGRDVPTPSPAPLGDANAPPDANDIFQNIRAQYMEALYHSKVPSFPLISHSLAVLTLISGLVGVLCKRPAFPRQGGIPPGLGLQPRHERLGRVPQESRHDHHRH